MCNTYFVEHLGWVLLQNDQKTQTKSPTMILKWSYRDHSDDQRICELKPLFSFLKFDRPKKSSWILKVRETLWRLCKSRQELREEISKAESNQIQKRHWNHSKCREGKDSLLQNVNWIFNPPDGFTPWRGVGTPDSKSEESICVSSWKNRCWIMKTFKIACVKSRLLWTAVPSLKYPVIQMI